MKKLKLIQSFAFIRRLLSVFRHYKQLNLHLFPKQKCFEFFPGVPYGLPSSKDFIKACKNGKTGIINEFIDQNKWLVHVYDFSGKTGLHWAAIRGHLPVIQILLENQAYIDTNDLVFKI